MPEANSFRACTKTRRRQRPGGLPPLLGVVSDGRSESLQVFIAQFLLNMELGGFIRVVHDGLLCWEGSMQPWVIHNVANRLIAMPCEGGARGQQRRRIRRNVKKLRG